MNFHSKTHDSEDDMLDDDEYRTHSHSYTADQHVKSTLTKTVQPRQCVHDTNDNEEIQFDDDNRITAVLQVIDDDKDFDDNKCNAIRNMNTDDNKLYDRQR